MPAADGPGPGGRAYTLFYRCYSRTSIFTLGLDDPKTRGIPFRAFKGRWDTEGSGLHTDLALKADLETIPGARRRRHGFLC